MASFIGIPFLYNYVVVFWHGDQGDPMAIGISILFLLINTFRLTYDYKINVWLSANEYVQYVAGLVFIILGFFSIRKNYLKRRNKNLDAQGVKEVESDETKIIYPIQLIVKGLGLNAINPGVLMFWIAACTYATNELKLTDVKLFTFFGITLLTMFSVDVLKIYFSIKLKEKLTNNTLSIIGILIGCLLMFFGLAIFFKDSI